MGGIQMEIEKEKLFCAPRRKLAKWLGVHHSTVWKQLQKLQKEGYLISFYSNGRKSLYYTKRQIKGDKNG